MAFKIVITTDRTETKTEHGSYSIVAERPYNEEELVANGLNIANEHMEVRKIRGYPPDREVSKVVEREVYTQTLEVLDLHELVTFINRKKRKAKKTDA